MRLLDLFCGAGGAAMGYYQAGFTDITGVDIAPQKHYPFTFVEGDALEYLAEYGHEYSVIHASPPCQAYSEATPLVYRHTAPKLIAPVQQALRRLAKPYVIENVENARKHLHDPIMLCGTMFGLPLWRHRYFECWPSLFALLPDCQHNRRPVTLHSGSHTRQSIAPILVSGSTRRTGEPRRDYSAEEKRLAMGISWMMTHELDQAIPPAYTRFIGEQLLTSLQARRTA